MFGFGWDDDEPVVSSRAQTLVRKIRELRSLGTMITLSQNMHLRLYEKELEELRKTCSHTYTVILMFNRHRRWCRVCDMEDITYKHQV